MTKRASSKPSILFMSASAVLLATSFSACGDDEDDGTGGGGSDATGGTAARGGSAGKGGTAGQGGSSGTAGLGGTSGKGGSAGKGGTAGRGGADAGMGGDDAGGMGGEGGGPELADPCRGLEIPSDQHYTAPGLCARAVATAQGRLRQIGFTSNGDLIGVTVPGAIVRYRDANENGSFSGSAEIVTLGTTGSMNGNNAHVDENAGYLYAGTEAGVARWEYSDDSDTLGTRQDVVVGQPSTGTHTYHTVHVFDGWLYVHSGSENNAVAPASPDYDLNRSVLKRFNLANFSANAPFQWTAGEVFAAGLRNMVGFTRNAAGRMYGVVNGMDNLMYGGEDVHLNNPGDELVRLVQGGRHGYPYCFTAQHILQGTTPVGAGTQLVSATDPTAPDPDFVNPRDQAWCTANSTPPVTFLPAHSAPLDITFFDGPSGNLPAAWQGGAFVALHGSWNTMPSIGHSVVFIPFDSAGNAPMPIAEVDETDFPYTVVFGGGQGSTHDDGIWGWSAGGAGEDPVRPVGVAVSPVDGALYVSSDNGTVFGGPMSPLQGAIYRIGLSRD
jgi:glucose/arabinose dehydrogenase